MTLPERILTKPTDLEALPHLQYTGTFEMQPTGTLAATSARSTLTSAGQSGCDSRQTEHSTRRLAFM